MKNILKFFILLTGIFILNSATAQLSDPVKWKTSSKKISECEYELQFTGTIEETWHVYSLNIIGDDGPMPTRFDFDKNPDFELVGKTTEGTPVKVFDKVFAMEVAYFEKTVSFKQKIRLKAGKEIVIKGNFEYQACTEEKCIFQNHNPIELKLKGSAECEKGGVKLVPVETGNLPFIIDSEAVAKAFAFKNSSASESKNVNSGSTVTASVSQNNNFKKEDDDTSLEGKSWWSILLTGFLWGFAALFTPCVFPLIPMNVSFFLKRSKTKAKGKLNAVLYALSIIVIFVSLGLGISGICSHGSGRSRCSLANVAGSGWRCSLRAIPRAAGCKARR